ncbi:hypothetical protein AB6A40_010488 [Gnathostoma spinigerum]|uniref:Uncharacterized protein n=1 Tax=Gnathostoma spinigerum TaxID=75299 RepID=A0ABD6F1N1_9BILA
MQNLAIVVCICSILSAVVTSETEDRNVNYDAFYDAFIGMSTAITQVIGTNSETDHLRFTQTLDHFNNLSKETWEQHYAINEDYRIPDGPAILFLTAQYSSPSELIKDKKYPVVEYAKRLNATLFMLEHRYFGSSQPFS